MITKGRGYCLRLLLLAFLTEMFAAKPYLRVEALITRKTAYLLKDLESYQALVSNVIIEGDEAMMSRSPEEQPRTGDDSIKISSSDDDSSPEF